MTYNRPGPHVDGRVVNVDNPACGTPPGSEVERLRGQLAGTADLLRRYEAGRTEGLGQEHDYWAELDRDVNRVLLGGGKQCRIHAVWNEKDAPAS